ncbi:hypothetical protein Tco_0919436 [Tanacetum coccineum]
MTNLADKAILSGADNRPPMLEKDMYDSCKSIMELYMMNRQHGRMILESVENGPLIWPSIEENRVTRPKKYSELSATEAIQANFDIKATNIILQRLPPEVYALDNMEFRANEDRLMHEQNSDPLALVYGSPYQYQQYSTHQSSTLLSITYPSNDYQSSIHHNVYSPSSSIPQLEYAPLVNQQSEFSQPESGLIVPVFQKGDDPIDAINHMMSFLTAVGRQTSLAAGKGYMSKQCTKPKRKRDDSWFKDKVLLVQAQASGQNLHEEELTFLADTGIPEGNNNHDKVNNNMINQVVQVMPSSEQSNVVNHSETEITSDSNIIPYSHVNDTLTAELERYKEQVKVLKEGQNVDLRSNDNVSDSNAQSVEIDRLKQTLSEHLKEKESLMQTVSFLKDDFKKEESRNIDREIALEKRIKQLDNILYVGDIIEKTNPIVIPDSEETLMLAEESRSKMLLKQKDPIMLEKKVNTTPVDYARLNQLSQDFNYVISPEPTLSSRPTKVEVPKELLKVSMVNSSLKKLKHHLAGFDMVVKEKTTPTTITEGSWGFEHTKACFRDEIISFVNALKDLFNTFNQYLVDELLEVQNVFHQMEQAVEQHRLESKTFEVKMNHVLNENKRLLEQVISKYIVNILVNSSVNIASVNVHECEKCLKLENELFNKKDFVEKEIYDKLFKSFTTLEKHCISLEVDTQHNQEIFQRDNSVSNQSAPSFD